MGNILLGLLLTVVVPLSPIFGNPSAQITQKRTADRKQIYLPEGDWYREVLLCSEQSEFFVEEKGKRATLSERMEGVECWVQEKLIEGESPGQVICYFEADCCHFDYGTGELAVERATVRRYRSSGHQLPGQEETLLFEGEMDFMALPLRGRKQVVFRGESLKANLFPSSEESYDLFAGKMIQQGGRLVFSDGIEMHSSYGKVVAGKLEVIFDEKEMALCELVATGHVALSDEQGNQLYGSCYRHDLKNRSWRLFEPQALFHGWSVKAAKVTSRRLSKGVHSYSLEGDVAVFQRDGLGFMTDQQLTMLVENRCPVRLLGFGELEFYTAARESNLSCVGGLHCDLQTGTGVLLAANGDKVCFQNLMGQVEANLLYFTFSDQLEQLLLEGAVYLKNQLGGDQYALADRLLFDSQEGRVSLSSFGKGRVLFSDPVSNLAVSASSLDLQRGADSKWGVVSSPALVRFTFNEAEALRLKSAISSRERE